MITYFFDVLYLFGEIMPGCFKFLKCGTPLACPPFGFRLCFHIYRFFILFKRDDIPPSFSFGYLMTTLWMYPLSIVLLLWQLLTTNDISLVHTGICNAFICTRTHIMLLAIHVVLQRSILDGCKLSMCRLVFLLARLGIL